MIHVAYAVHDASGGYSKFAGVSIASLLDKTKENVTIHLLRKLPLRPAPSCPS